MSILTKILIVLLAFCSFFLCATVVTYVSSADNYKEKFENQRRELQAAESRASEAQRQFKEKDDELNRQKTAFTKQIVALKIELKEVNSELIDAEREKSDLLTRVSGLAGMTQEFYATVVKQTDLFEKTFAELKKVQSEKIEQKKELDDTTVQLLEKMAIIEDLDKKAKRLHEERTDLENRLNKLLMSSGKAVAPVRPVRRPRTVRTAPVAAIALQGLVTRVNPDKKMLEISIGRAHGVREGMKFHISRSGGQFIRDILILEVDEERSVGIFDVGTRQPRIGDTAVTNF